VARGTAPQQHLGGDTQGLEIPENFEETLGHSLNSLDAFRKTRLGQKGEG